MHVQTGGKKADSTRRPHLARQPLIGRARKELATDLRSFPFGRYVIFYTPVHDGIDVVRVLHSARDIDAAFGEEP